MTSQGKVSSWWQGPFLDKLPPPNKWEFVEIEEKYKRAWIPFENLAVSIWEKPTDAGKVEYQINVYTDGTPVQLGQTNNDKHFENLFEVFAQLCSVLPRELVTDAK